MSHINKTVWFIIQQHHLLLLKDQTYLPTESDISSLKPTFSRYFSFALEKQTHYLCAEINETTPLPENLQRLPLKQALTQLDIDNYNFAVKAYSLIQWDKNHQYCSRCRQKTINNPKVFEKYCPHCLLRFYPRISPSIIVLIQKGKKLLMARSPHYPKGVYGLIAGFVEAGESLEEALHREVKEEVGITIKNIHYFGSQPWPFPDSLMIAFTAEHRDGQIKIDNDEIEHADWYPYHDLPGRPSSPISIASKLIDDFINKHAKKA
jgi:NAD+ diphosphatase